MNGSLLGPLLEHNFEREDKAVAAKSTYDVLLSEIRKQYPDFDLHKNAFKTHVGQ